MQVYGWKFFKIVEGFVVEIMILRILSWSNKGPFCDSKMRPPNVPKQQNEAEDQSVNDVSEDQSINGVEELAMDDSGKALWYPWLYEAPWIKLH